MKPTPVSLVSVPSAAEQRERLARVNDAEWRRVRQVFSRGNVIKTDLKGLALILCIAVAFQFGMVWLLDWGMAQLRESARAFSGDIASASQSTARSTRRIEQALDPAQWNTRGMEGKLRHGVDRIYDTWTQDVSNWLVLHNLDPVSIGDRYGDTWQRDEHNVQAKFDSATWSVQRNMSSGASQVSNAVKNVAP